MIVLYGFGWLDGLRSQINKVGGVVVGIQVQDNVCRIRYFSINSLIVCHLKPV